MGIRGRGEYISRWVFYFLDSGAETLDGFSFLFFFSIGKLSF